MNKQIEILGKRKNIALIAHDHMKDELLEWASFNRGSLSKHHIFATGTTGMLLETTLDLPVNKVRSGPLGGDMQIGAMISNGEIDMLIFFWDPLEMQPHDPDIRALLRLAVVWNIPLATNRASADFIFSSHLMHEEYERIMPDYDQYRSKRFETFVPPSKD